jgi:hypothetical protein
VPKNPEPPPPVAPYKLPAESIARGPPAPCPAGSSLVKVCNFCSPQASKRRAADASAADTWEVPYDRQRPLLLAMWCCALYLAYVLARGVWSWLYP